MAFPLPIPFVDHLGFEFVRYDAGEAEIAIALNPDLTNTWGVAHGGVTMTLLDIVMAHAARSPNQAGHDPSKGVITIEMKTTFMRPGTGRLLGRGKVLHRTGSTAFCEGSVFDVQGLLIAHATGTFKFLTGLPVDGKLVERQNASD
jgi:uncharacterized protein (TIGR00369 family)